jgi:hypothetical protein
MVPSTPKGTLMRLVLLATLAMAVSTPAFAETKPSQASQEMQAMADSFNDPSTQRAMTGALDAMIGAMLNMRIDGFVKALEPMNGGKKIKLKGKTLGEMAAHEDRNFDTKLKTGTRAMVGGMGAMASALAGIMPELEVAMEKMDKAMEKVGDKVPQDR